MPIYEYSCRACGSEFEKLVASQAAAVVVCPSCTGDRVIRRISLVGVKTGNRAAGATAVASGGGCCGGGCGCH